MTIRYFAATHRGSTAYWSDGIGKANIAAICKHLEGQPLGYWAANSGVASYFEHRLPGRQVSPKIAGTNELMRHEVCAMIYSAKALPSDLPLLTAFGLKPADIERAREGEDIFQFALRGAPRCPDFDGEFVVYLYDRWQAEALARMLRDSGVAAEVSLEHVVGVIEDVPRPKRGPTVKDTGETHEQRQQRKRDEARERQRRCRARKQGGRVMPVPMRRGR